LIRVSLSRVAEPPPAKSQWRETKFASVNRIGVRDGINIADAMCESAFVKSGRFGLI
jgi:hypothetical protein